jgi:hypothetical protein
LCNKWVGCVRYSRWCGGEPEAALSQVQMDGLDEEGLIGVSRASILARPEQEEVESNGDGVGNGAVTGVSGRGVSVLEGVGDEGERDGLDSDWWVVLQGVAPEEVGKTKVDLAVGVEAGVFGPHAGAFLCHRPEDILHCARLDGSTAGRKSSVAVTLRIDLEERDWVWVILEVGVEVVGITKGRPTRPMVIVGSGAFRADSRSHRRLDKEHVSAEAIAVESGESSQGWVCGKAELKWESNSVSVRCQAREQVSAIRLTTPGR